MGGHDYLWSKKKSIQVINSSRRKGERTTPCRGIGVTGEPAVVPRPGAAGLRVGTVSVTLDLNLFEVLSCPTFSFSFICKRCILCRFYHVTLQKCRFFWVFRVVVK